jgi:acyl-CoA thioesterase I
MMPITAWLLVAAITTSQATCESMTDLPPILQNVHRIVTMGDSITQGGEGPNGYVGLMRKALREHNIEVINAGISGNKATDMQARFQRDVIDKKPDLVTISVGVNDVWHGYRDFARGVNHPKGDTGNGVPLPLYREKVTAMIDATLAAGAKAVLLAPTLIYEDLNSVENRALATYIATMKEIAREKGCLFIDLHAPFRKIIAEYDKYAGTGQNLLTTDGVHMNDAGNRVMAYTILKGLGVRSPQLR